MNNFGRSHREDFGELVEDLKMNRNEREEMKEYVERYVFDVRFQKISRNHHLTYLIAYIEAG